MEILTQIAIIEVTYTNYTEREIVYAGQADQIEAIKNQKDFVSMEVIEGELESNEPQIETCTIIQHKAGYTNETTDLFLFNEQRNKVKYMGDTCGAYTPRFQKIKSSSLGEYILIHGERWYIEY